MLVQRLTAISTLAVLALSGAACGGDAPTDTGDTGDTGVDEGFVCETTAADEDYVDFGSMAGFTAPGSWAVIEKVKLPDDFETTGWHVFRGKAWEDLPGDLAISLRSDRVKAWYYAEPYVWDDVELETTVEPDTWYTVCFQHDTAGERLELYFDGALVDTLEDVSAKDDSANTHKLLFGGQDVAADQEEGDLYSEADIVIAHQAWFQRILTSEEISAYDGTLDSLDESGLFFETEIGATGITDASGNGHDGTNGNSPEYYLESL